MSIRHTGIAGALMLFELCITSCTSERPIAPPLTSAVAPERSTATATTASPSEASKPAMQVVPTKAEKVRQTHNAKVAAIPSVWAMADFQAFWTDIDKDHKFRSEKGYGHIIFLRPKNSVFFQWENIQGVQATVACNDEFFWIISYQPDKTFFIGRNENAYQDCCTPPMFVHPIDMISLSGLVTIPDDATFQGVPASPNQDEQFIWTFDSPRSWYSIRVCLEAPTGLPWRVALVRKSDDAVLGASLLTQYKRFGDYQLPHSIVITTALSQDSQLRITVQEAHTKPKNRREIDPSLFDIDKVMEGAGACQRVVLDARCPHPALAPED